MLALCLLALAAAPPGFSAAPPLPAPPSAAPVVRAPPEPDSPPAPAIPTVEAPKGPPAPPVPQVPTLEAPKASTTPGAVALEHDGRLDGAAVVSDLGLAITAARPVLGAHGPLFIVYPDGRRIAAQLLAADPARDLALLRLGQPGPAGLVELAASAPALDAPLTVLLPPGAQPWGAVPAQVAARTGLHAGRADPLRFTARVATPVFSEGGAVLDAEGKLVGIVAAPEPHQDPTEVVAVSVDAIRAFLDASGAAVPEFNLTVVTAPPGAAITVDGRPVGAPTPLRIAHLNVGRHQLALSAAGMATDVVTVELLRHGEESLHRTLDPGGTLEVATQAPVDVWVDGTLRGRSPLRIQVPSGHHVLDLRSATTEPFTQSVEIAQGQVSRIDVKLDPVRASISMATTPSGAQVTVNGVAVGQTPLAHVKVPAGNVKIGIRAEGHHAYEFPVTLAPGEDRDLGSFRLEDPYAWIQTNLPHGTEIAIDGAPRHPAQPYERIPVGEHAVHLFVPDYYAYSQSVKMADAQTLQLDPPLARYDRLPPRRAFGIGLTALGAAAGLVSIGLATSDSSKSAVAPTLIGGAIAVGAGIWCLVTSRNADQAGWSEERVYPP